MILKKFTYSDRMRVAKTLQKVILIYRTTHLHRIGNVAVGFICHKSFYQLMPNAI